MATPHRLRHQTVGVFGSVPAYVRDATFAPMDEETLAPYVAPWGAVVRRGRGTAVVAFLIGCAVFPMAGASGISEH